jgi:serine/threonine-protein kinase RsbW
VEHDSFSIVLNNELSDLPSAVERVEAFCRTWSIPERTIHRFILALDEALTNVMTHAFSDGLRHGIEVQVAFRDGALTATVSDDGVPFDPLSQPAPDIHAPLEDRKIGGLGIHLIRSMMDAVEYRRTNSRNHLTFRTHVGTSKPT